MRGLASELRQTEVRWPSSGYVNVYQSAGADFDRDAAIQYSTMVYPGAERELVAMLDGIDRGEDVPL